MSTHDPRFTTLPAVIDVARATLDPDTWEWISGGTSGEQSLAANRSAFDQWFFVRDMLSGVPPVDLSSTVFGLPVSMPVFVSPFGSDGAMHADRYPAVARALAATGTTSIVSETSTDSLEAIAEACSGQQGMVQVSLLGGDDHLHHFAERAAAAGYRGLCLTDTPTGPWRERMLRRKINFRSHSGVGNQGAGAPNPGVLQRDPSQPRWDWERLARVGAELALPWILKGVLTADQAKRSVDAGASGVYVSNFGGRNLDGYPPTVDVLPEVVEAVDGQVPVIVDSGFRRGTDVAKALALGADAVGIGRLAAWGFAAGGEAGATAVLELLRAELTSVVGNLGVSRPAELAPRHVRRIT